MQPQATAGRPYIRSFQPALAGASFSPAPLSFFDGTIHMGPAVVLRGDPRAERYYETLAGELEGRIVRGEGAIAEERHRFYWEGMPIWGKLREHAELFAGLRSCVVASTYCGSWIFEALGAADPFEGMALACYAIGARTGYIFVRAQYDKPHALLTRALEEARPGLGPIFQKMVLQPDGRVSADTAVSHNAGHLPDELTRALLRGYEEILVTEVLAVKKALGPRHETALVKALEKIG